MAKENMYVTDIYPKTLAVAVHAPYNKTRDIDSYFEEFFNLIKTNRIEYDHVEKIKLRSIDPGYFLTKGKLEDLKKICDEQEIEEVIFSEPLSARQEKNLQDYLHCKVFDRTQLILEIFEKAATSAEGKLQVDIAMLHHAKSRLAGKGIHLAQQSGRIGMRSGAGETLKEKETREIEGDILKLKRQLQRMHKARETQRKQRLSRGVPHICLIGYTNAGKSSILNALTHSGVLVEDKLFATLDTTTRELYVDSQKVGVISDTVGFIQNLPHNLIDAFKSTLSELQYADLLLHVVDLSDPNYQDHIEIVNDILEELGVDKNMLYVFNKADKVEDIDDMIFQIEHYQPNVVISTLSKKGMEALVHFLNSWKPKK